jgi:hypothetical protein
MTREQQTEARPRRHTRRIAAAMAELQRWRERVGGERQVEKLGRIHGLPHGRTHGTKRG